MFWLCVCRWGPLAVHAAPAAGMASGVQRCLWLIHQCSTGVQGVLQPTAALGPVHHGQHSGPSFQWQCYCTNEQVHITTLHSLPDYHHGCLDLGASYGLSHGCRWQFRYSLDAQNYFTIQMHFNYLNLFSISVSTLCIVQISIGFSKGMPF